MDNKTPPAWAYEAASELEKHRDILELGKADAIRPPHEYFSEEAKIISSCAPDAEALAEALESTCAWLENWTLAGKTMTGSNDKIILESFLKEWSLTLAAYRASFPKAKVTP